LPKDQSKTSPVLFCRTTRELHRRARVRAAAEEISMSELMERALRHYLREVPLDVEQRKATRDVARARTA
jgi:hypothetical protein